MKIIENEGILAGVPSTLPIGIWNHNSVLGDCWRLAAVGDIGLSGRMGRRLADGGTVGEMFEIIAPALRACDCVLGNLETPLVDEWSPSKLFAGPSNGTKPLADVGFHVLHLASNHMFDHGSRGFEQCISAVEQAGMTALGAGSDANSASRLVIRVFNGRRVGFLGAGHTRINQPATPRLWELNSNDLLLSTQAAKKCVDLLIVSIHWGPMLVDYPYLEQRALGRSLVAAGASAVLMHHAHVLQGVEVCAGVPICYNLGNCLFDPAEGLLQRAASFRPYKYQEQITSCVFFLEWQGDQFARVMAAPLRLPWGTTLESKCGLQWADINEAMRILARLEKISHDLDGDFQKMLSDQLLTVKIREIRHNLSLIIRHGQLWRLGWLLRQFDVRRLKMLFNLVNMKRL